MTDRRTLTLNWRPVGQPARRYDDFAEVPYTPPLKIRREDPARFDRRDIDERLGNWGRWANSEYRTINRSATAAFCDRLRREAGQEVCHSDERRKMDEADALLLERSLLRLRGTQKQILRMHYAQGRQWQPIMRVLQFPVRREMFDRLLANAQGAIEMAALQLKERQG